MAPICSAAFLRHPQGRGTQVALLRALRRAEASSVHSTVLVVIVIALFKLCILCLQSYNTVKNRPIPVA
jgi:hypothetical protein